MYFFFTGEVVSVQQRDLHSFQQKASQSSLLHSFSFVVFHNRNQNSKCESVIRNPPDNAVLQRERTLH